MDTLLQAASDAQCQAPMTFGAVTAVVIVCCVLGLLWALVNVYQVSKIDVEKGEDGESDSLVGDIPE